MFHLIRPGTQIDFVGKRHIWMGISILSILATFVLFFTKGLNYGIDFSGGAEVEIKVPNSLTISEVRSLLDAKNIPGLKVQAIGEANSGEFLIKAQGDENSLNQVSGQIESAFVGKVEAGQFEVRRVNVVGPAAGGNLRKAGFLSMIYALICILLYVTIRFDFRYSPGAVLALFHDSMITLGIFMILGKSFDLLILAAILALVGYSNNDTIIVYDRVRETKQLNPSLDIKAAVNKAINETLGRTILTSMTTFFTAFALWMFGGDVIHDFAFTFMIGIVVGSYSSIFIASSFVIYLTEYQERKKHKGGQSNKRKYMVRPEPKLGS